MKFIAFALNIAVLLQSSSAQIFNTGKGGKGGKGYPTAAPTTSPAPTACRDNPNKFLVPGSASTNDPNEKHSCAWVIRGGGSGPVPWRCNKYPEAALNCRITCDTCIPSEAPSAAPTASPTASPSASPTASPSASPTPAPSASPTPAPSASPTASPSASPTASPSASPTASPSASPTASPSASPTPAPSASPTPAPSAAPTASPSASPTASPTASPSASPTASPTDSPSASPTASPTPGPTLSPTKAPTITPTVSPTITPTSSPTCKTPSKGGKGKGVKCTESPSTSPSPTICQDTKARFPVNGATQTCDWVIRGGGSGTYPWRCAAYGGAGAAACKQTCGGCGCQDTAEKFDVQEATGIVAHTCAWVERKQTTQRCLLPNVKFHCPKTCGTCV